MRERHIYYPITKNGLADRFGEPPYPEQLPHGQPPDGRHDLGPQQFELA